MTFLPVAQRELLVASRRRALFRLRGGAGILAVLMGFFGLLFSWGTGARSGGAPVFAMLVVLTAVVSVLAGLILTTDAIAAERREGTLGFLLLTDLTGFDILAGKLAAALTGAATALLAAFPVLAIAMIMGGITGGEFWRTTLALINLLWVAVTVGLLVSVLTRASGLAFFTGAIVLLFLTLLLPAAAASARAGGLTAGWEWLWRLSPTEALQWAESGAYGIRAAPFWLALFQSHWVGWLALGGAAWWLPRSWRNEVRGAASLNQASAQTPKRVLDGQNPVTVLSPSSRRERMLVWAVVALSLGWMLWSGGWSGVTVPVWGSPQFSPGFLVLKCIYAWRCCMFFQGLRHGAGELLLTTPLEEKDVIRGGWDTVRLPLLLPLVVMIGAYALSAVGGAVISSSGVAGGIFSGMGNLLLATYVVGCLAVDWLVIAWLSVRFGVKANSPMAAFGKTMAVLLLPRLAFCVPDLLISAVVFAWARGSLAHTFLPGLPTSQGVPEGYLKSALRGS